MAASVPAHRAPDAAPDGMSEGRRAVAGTEETERRVRVELRWFAAGEVPVEVDAWLDGLGRDRIDLRVDHYAVVEAAGHSVKFRGGRRPRFEVKAWRSDPVEVDLGDGVVGTAEWWGKERRGAAPGSRDLPRSGVPLWAPVAKVRRRVPGAEVVALRLGAPVDVLPGTPASVGGADAAPWWSVAVELPGTSSPLAVRRRAAELLAGFPLPSILHAGASHSYASWLIEQFAAGHVGPAGSEAAAGIEPAYAALQAAT